VSNAIRFLETMGSNPSVGANYAAVIAALDVPPQQRRALLARDHAELGTLLGGREAMKCLVFSQEEVIR
jgi:hypothetical protein